MIVGHPFGGAGAATTWRSVSDASVSSSIASFGAPKWIDSIGSDVQYSSPTYATINGVVAVVAAGLNGRVYVVNADTGAALPGWSGGRPAIMRPGEAPSAIDSSPTVAYLDGKSNPPSIIVGVGSQSRPCQNGGVIAFRADGKIRFVFHTLHTFNQWGSCTGSFDNSVFSTIAVGPVKKGQMDIVFGSFDHRLYALSPSGVPLPGFPVNRADTIWSSPALVDYTHTGKDDIIEGGDSSGWSGPNGGSHCYGGWISDYRDVNNAPKLIWEHCIGQTVWSSPAIGAITPGSTRLAAVFGTSWNPHYSSNGATHELFAYYVNGGQRVSGWPVKAYGPTFPSPAIARLSPTSSPVVVSSSCSACMQGPAVIREWSEVGHENWSTWVTPRYEMQASPVVADVLGTPDQNVLIGITSGLYILSGTSGQVIGGPLQDGCRMLNSPVVFPNPAVPSGWELAMSCAKGGEAKLVAYGVPATPPMQPAWPQWRGDESHNGH
jgi:hypothetical protein